MCYFIKPTNEEEYEMIGPIAVEPLYDYLVQVFDSGQLGEVRLDDGDFVVTAPAAGHLHIVQAVSAAFPAVKTWFNYHRPN
jgi:hypothetical protein